MNNVTAKEEHFQTKESIKSNEPKTKRLLHERKLNNLKYKRETTREETLQPTKKQTAFNKSNTSALSAANNVKYNKHVISRNTSNTNTANEF